MAKQPGFAPDAAAGAASAGSGALQSYPDIPARGSNGDEIRSNRDAAERHAESMSYSGRVQRLSAVAGDTTEAERQVVSSAKQLRTAANNALDQLTIDVENVKKVAWALDNADRACATGF